MLIFLLTILLLIIVVAVAIAAWPITLLIIAVAIIGTLLWFSGLALLIWGNTIVPAILLFIVVFMVSTLITRLTERYPALLKKLF